MSHIFFLHPLRFDNTKSSNRKDAKNIILCETKLKTETLVEKSSNGSALSTNYKKILCVASNLYFHNDPICHLHIPSISKMKTSDKDLEKGFNIGEELEAGI